MARPTLSSISIENDVEMAFEVEVNGTPAVALLDPGASHIFLSKECASQCGLTVSGREETSVQLGDGSMIAALGTTTSHIQMEEIESEEVCYTVPITSRYERPYIIIGRSWLRKHNPEIDWTTCIIQVPRSDGKVPKIRPRAYKEKKKVTMKHI